MKRLLKIGIGLLLTACNGEGQTVASRVSSETPQEQVIFRVEDECKFRPVFGVYWMCSGAHHRVEAAAASPTNDPYLNAIYFKNSLVVDFTCQGNARAEIQTSSGLSLRLAPTATTALQTISLPVSRAGGTYTITILTETPGTTLAAGCHFGITGNVTLPSVESLKWYRDELRQQAETSAALAASINEAAELPAKWGAVLGLPKMIDDQIKRSRFDLELARAEAGDLKVAASNRALTDLETARLSDLEGEGGTISFLVADIKRLETIGQNVKDAVSISSTCQGSPTGTDLSLCISKVEGVGRLINESTQRIVDRIASFSSFINSEIERLGSVEAGLVARLRELVKHD